ncbi:hypothetical protein BRADI_3g22357v3 [Brachypodium distachyon]|uniref:Uncharacterized protein n=1 Tax=Brachypodium distachyon TaxID=15368 RepID=A0A0Q3JDA1_BRADI|nr:hypothetical protein BRADI_3g22357v3 [Brachypodium distachyon]
MLSTAYAAALPLHRAASFAPGTTPPPSPPPTTSPSLSIDDGSWSSTANKQIGDAFFEIRGGSIPPIAAADGEGRGVPGAGFGARESSASAIARCGITSALLKFGDPERDLGRG